MRRNSVAALALLALLACRDESRTASRAEPPVEPPRTGEVFPVLPLPPNAEIVSRGGSADALQLTFRSPIAPGQVAEYYRDQLTKGRWRLISDTKTADGAVVLYAEHDGPLWVRIWSEKDQPGTLIQLAGARVAKDTPRAGQEGSSMSSKRSRRG